MDKEIVEGLSYIKSSKNRFKIIKSIDNSFKMPSEISNETEIRLNHVSALLSDLKNNDMVVCLNEDKSKGRIYCLTDYGKEIIKILNEK